MTTNIQTTESSDGTLVCSACKLELPKSAFYKTTNYWHQKRGYSYACKKCCQTSAKKSSAKRIQEMKNDTGTDDII